MGKPKNKQGRRQQQEVTDLDSFNASKEIPKATPKQAGEELTPAQRDFVRACEHLEETNMQHFFNLDNKIIEALFHRTSHYELSPEEARETPDEEAFLFFLRQAIQELSFVAALPYAKFWAQMAHGQETIAFLDTLLSNLRTENDTHKLQIFARC